MDPIWIIIAFGLGWTARQARLPPLLGFLAAGFVLGACGVKGGVVLAKAADLGVWLLLFSIGLKLKLGQLKRPEVLVVATVHLGFMVVLGAGVLLGLGALGVPFLADLDSRSRSLCETKGGESRVILGTGLGGEKSLFDYRPNLSKLG